MSSIEAHGVQQTREPLRLAVLAGAARSGTTLTRLLLNAHPHIASPAEAGIPSLMGHMANVWSVVSGASRRQPRGLGQPSNKNALHKPTVVAEDSPRHVEVDAPAQTWIMATLQEVMRQAGGDDTKWYIDKSLDSVYYLPIVKRLVPDARFIFLFRHPMDAIASGLEASPWGFQAYGYSPFVQVSPHNFVAALGNYWLTHVTTALKWADENPAISLKIRYEDLVTEPATVLREAFGFLGVDDAPDAVKRAFGKDIVPRQTSPRTR